MTHSNRIVGAALATAAAALFIAGTGVGSANESAPSVVKAKCFGGNACKGQETVIFHVFALELHALMPLRFLMRA